GPQRKRSGSATGLEDIRRTASRPRLAKTGLESKVQQIDLSAPYRAKVLSFLELKRPLTVAIDASNGMAGKMVPAVFGDVPGLTIVPILFEITGSFTHEPNPLVESNLDMLKEKVREVKPHLGACFDGDADRCMFVDENAKLIGSDIITALLAKDFLAEEKNKGATVVYDLRSSHVVPDVIKEMG